MPTRRFYVNSAPQQTLASAITSSATSLTIQSSFAGWPASFPFFATLETGTANQEHVLVTSISGLTATVTRGQDSSIAVAHSAGATVDQMFIRQDADEANAHTSASAGVHGISGSVVGTSDVQTLSNKTLTSPIVNTPTISSPAVTGTLAGASETLSGTLAVTGAVSAGSVSTAGAVTTTSGGGAAVSAANGTITGKAVKPVTEFVLPTYANEAARDAAITAPAAGDACVITAPTTWLGKGIWLYDGTAWVPQNTASNAASGTTDASGFATITHGLGRTPTSVWYISTLTGGSAALQAAGVDTVGATTFRIRFGGVTSAASYALRWFALP